MAESDKATEFPLPENVWERIRNVMWDLPYIQKRKEMNLGGGRPVKTLAYEDLAEQVQPLLVKHGLVLMSDLVELNVDTIESEKPGYNPGDPPKKIITTIATVKMRFQLRCCTVDSETPWLTYPGMGFDTSDKAVGKATTYAAKDFLRKMFVVPSGEEPEDDNHERPSKAPPKPVVTAADSLSQPIMTQGSHVPAAPVVDSELLALAKKAGKAGMTKETFAGLLKVTGGDVSKKDDKDAPFGLVPGGPMAAQLRAALQQIIDAKK